MVVKITELSSYVIVIIIVAIAISIGGTVLTSLHDEALANSGIINGSVGTFNNSAVNATTQGLASMTNLATWIPIMALVIAASAVIGVVMYMFGRG